MSAGGGASYDPTEANGVAITAQSAPRTGCETDGQGAVPRQDVVPVLRGRGVPVSARRSGGERVLRLSAFESSLDLT